ncbi:hypothetical protein [Streptomyces hokutonensis]|uniref:hypothetical protein n=1 Tax=Streptomyces hokutonensis TaxID=1306990 RepID=UPI0033C4047D
MADIQGSYDDIRAASDVDGLLVCGGLTPAYQDAFAGCLDLLPGLLAERRIPYAGFSAGAALAARSAVVGGWLLDGVPVCPEDTAEDLEEIAVRPVGARTLRRGRACGAVGDAAAADRGRRPAPAPARRRRRREHAGAGESFLAH